MAFIKKEMYDQSTGLLVRSWREGKGPVRHCPTGSNARSAKCCSLASTTISQKAQADDYAFFVQALIKLYSITGHESHIVWAIQLQDKMDELFEDKNGGGYWASEEDELVLVRMKDSQVSP